MEEMKNLKEKKENKKGFTLVETLVAIFILVLSVTGPMSAAQSSLKASFLARDQVSAFYLAQDAIEYLRNEKDTNMILKINDPNQKILNTSIISNCGGGTVPCQIDTTNNFGISDSIKVCGGSQCAPLCFDSTTKQYKPSDGSCSTLSKFTREIYLQSLGDASIEDEYKVTVVIKWKSNFLSDKRIVVQENIYNWLIAN